MSGELSSNARSAAVAEGNHAAHEMLLDQVLKLAKLVEAVDNSLALPVGQTSARWRVLAEVEHRAAPVVAIADALDHTRQSVQRIADLLVEEELGRYRPNPAHRRAKLFELTPAGHEVLQGIRASRDRCTSRVGEGLDPERLEQACRTLTEVQHRLETELARSDSGPPGAGDAAHDAVTSLRSLHDPAG